MTHDRVADRVTDELDPPRPVCDDAEELDVAPAVIDERHGEALRPSIWSRVGQHPLLLVTGIATCVAAGHAWWIWTHRRVGALDPDEASYIAGATRLARLFTDDIGAVPRAIGGTGTGPLVPIMSVPLLWVVPDDPRAALLVQPLLMVVAAVAVAGIGLRLGGRGVAVASGVTFVLLPTVALATHTYAFALGAAAGLAGAMWALLASDRLTNRWTLAFGAVAGLMLLTRTMTVAFLPGLIVAALVVGGRPVPVRGLARAGGALLVVAAPWWLAQRGAVRYLVSYGYNERAAAFGGGGVLDRITGRLDRIGDSVGVPLLWLLLAVALVPGAVALWRRRQGEAEVVRHLVAIAVVVAAGFVALTTTSNAGVWFELPLVALLVPALVTIISKAPVPLRAYAGVSYLVAAILVLACAWWMIPPERDPVPLVAPEQRTTHYEPGFQLYDGRFAASRRDEQDAAAREWWRLTTDVERYLRDRTDGGEGGVDVTMSGNFQLFNTSTVSLAAQMEDWTLELLPPDTDVGRERRRDLLTPDARHADGSPLSHDGKPVERVLVLALHDQLPFPPDSEVKALASEAEEAGWAEERRFPIPGGGLVVVMSHLDAP